MEWFDEFLCEFDEIITDSINFLLIVNIVYKTIVFIWETFQSRAVRKQHSVLKL